MDGADEDTLQMPAPTPHRAPRAAAPRTAPPGHGPAFALGSGSQHGLAHIGVIRTMQVRGWMPGLVVGTSAGGIAGALWTLGGS